MGISLGIAVLLDALLVRLLLIPILLRLTGTRRGTCRSGSTASSRTSASATDTAPFEPEAEACDDACLGATLVQHLGCPARCRLV